MGEMEREMEREMETAPAPAAVKLKSLLDAIRSLDDLLTCPACYLRLDHPMLLSCDHLLCRSCLPTPTPTATPSLPFPCPHCNAISLLKDVRPSTFMADILTLSAPPATSLAPITRHFLSLPPNLPIATPNSFPSIPAATHNLVLLGFALTPSESAILTKFATHNHAITERFWKDNVTHVVISHENNTPSRRAFEFLMAILYGKWIISIQWISACLRESKLVPEEPYEVDHDSCGFFEGPKKGRTGVTNKAPKVFGGLGFYLSSYLEGHVRARLRRVLLAAGGTIMEGKDLGLHTSASTFKDGWCKKKKYIVVNEEEPQNFSKRDIRKSIEERSEEVGEFYRKTGSPCFVGYTAIADAIAALDAGILDQEYGGEWDALLVN